MADEVWDTEDYMESGRGVVMVDFKDTNALKVKVFGNDKEAPSPPASDDELEEGEIKQGSEEGEVIE